MCPDLPGTRTDRHGWIGPGAPSEGAGEIVVRSIAEESADPYSVQIRRLRRLPGPPEASWCGEVNVKGLAGGYLGFRPFFVIPATAGTFSSYSKDGGRNAVFDSMIEKHCR